MGLNVFSAALTIPTGGEVTLEVQLTGTIRDMGDTYRLLASSQPLANPDELTVQVRPAPGAPDLGDVRGLEAVGGVATDAGPWTTDRRYTIRFDEG